jgi:hypothetical protein
MIYCPNPKPEYSGKAPSYTYMHNKIKRLYHHVTKECIPMPSAASNVEEIRRDSLIVDMKELPAKFKETLEEYRDPLPPPLFFRTSGHAWRQY